MVQHDTQRWTVGALPHGQVHGGPAAEAEALVRDALQGRDPGESWFISLHRFHDGWDVFVEVPDPELREFLSSPLRRAGFDR